ncbi:hypothetical protein AVEN_55177-1 [Araneus ventricosus]|uniref:Uncharacterized protein n=1 Tax=Araneus ventricosus TaxID=182803 RepID=A0A4Y2WTG0_ARAVE|nr:hypothetical protein AVEN_55177-1 [Araneus ventricosus]
MCPESLVRLNRLSSVKSIRSIADLSSSFVSDTTKLLSSMNRHMAHAVLIVMKIDHFVQPPVHGKTQYRASRSTLHVSWGFTHCLPSAPSRRLSAAALHSNQCIQQHSNPFKNFTKSCPEHIISCNLH